MPSDLASDLQAPISPASPAGSDITYDDDFQRLKAAVDSIGSVNAGAVDYDSLVQLGTKILTQKAKDVRVAVFLAFGLERTNGIAGLADGLAALDGIVRTYWDVLYPPLGRMAGRQNALQSLSDRLKESVAAMKPAEEDRPHLERALNHVRDLQAFTLEVMADKAPALGGLSQALEGALRRVPAPRDASHAAATKSVNGEPSPAPSSASAPSHTAAGAGVAQATGINSLADVKNAVTRAVDYLKSQDPSNPIAYRLSRVVHWSGVLEEPPNEDGRTRIPAPPAQRREYLQRLLDQKKYELLIVEAEDTFHEFPFLLDAQRLMVLAMEALPAFAQAKDAVLRELMLLVRRIQSMPLLAFDDGTPFADGQTRAWIEMNLESVLQGDRGGRSGPTAESSPVEQLFQTAREQLGKGDLAAALATMQHGDGADISAGSRFRRMLYSAKLSLTAGTPALARSILETLCEEVERRGLAEWDPPLALEVWSALYQSLDESSRDAEAGERQALRERAAEMLERVCSLDAVKGLALIGKR